LVLTTGHYLYGLRKHADSLPTTLEEATQYRVGVSRSGFEYAFLENRNFENLVVARTFDQTLRMLERDRVDFIPMDTLSAALTSERFGFDSGALVAQIRLLEAETSLYMVLSKSTDLRVVDRLRAAYARVRSSGRYEQIVGPWMEIMDEQLAGTAR